MSNLSYCHNGFNSSIIIFPLLENFFILFRCFQSCLLQNYYLYERVIPISATDQLWKCYGKSRNCIMLSNVHQLCSRWLRKMKILNNECFIELSCKHCCKKEKLLTLSKFSFCQICSKLSTADASKCNCMWERVALAAVEFWKCCDKRWNCIKLAVDYSITYGLAGGVQYVVSKIT